jgi:hypothetical protein
LTFSCYEVFAKQKKKKRPRLYYLYSVHVYRSVFVIECARGPVELGTHGNVCRGYRNNTNFERLELLAINNRQRRKYGRTHNLTVEDLGWHAEMVCVGGGHL